MRFVFDIETLGQIFFRVLRFQLAIIISPLLQTHFSLNVLLKTRKCGLYGNSGAVAVIAEL